MKKILILFMFTSYACFGMDQAGDQHAGHKRKVEIDESSSESSDSETPKKTVKHKARVCPHKYLVDDKPCLKTNFKDRMEYNDHIRSQHVLRKISCPGCGKDDMFRNLMEHIHQCENDREGKAKALAEKVDATEIPQRCNKCKAIFGFISNLNAHLKKCDGQKLIIWTKKKKVKFAVKPEAQRQNLAVDPVVIPSAAVAAAPFQEMYVENTDTEETSQETLKDNSMLEYWQSMLNSEEEEDDQRIIWPKNETQRFYSASACPSDETSNRYDLPNLTDESPEQTIYDKLLDEYLNRKPLSYE